MQKGDFCTLSTPKFYPRVCALVFMQAYRCVEACQSLPEQLEMIAMVEVANGEPMSKRDTQRLRFANGAWVRSGEVGGWSPVGDTEGWLKCNLGEGQLNPNP